ncbi:hypothetical protein A2U01_0102739, partial [Trifolium medium]|nr:hypothetical protein [Trifolium medium]
SESSDSEGSDSEDCTSSDSEGSDSEDCTSSELLTLKTVQVLNL